MSGEGVWDSVILSLAWSVTACSDTPSCVLSSVGEGCVTPSCVWVLISSWVFTVMSVSGWLLVDVSIKLSGDEGIGLALDLFGAGTSKSDSSELEHLDFLLLCSSLDCVSCLNCFEPGVCSMASQSETEECRHTWREWRMFSQLPVWWEYGGAEKWGDKDLKREED